MTRDQFIVEFARRFRLVLQKHELEVSARLLVSRYGGRGWNKHADSELAHTGVMLDGAVSDLADLVATELDEKAPLSPTAS